MKSLIENPTATKRAFFTWQPPFEKDSNRFKVGEIVQNGDNVDFRYLDPSELKPAMEKGFDGYMGMPLDRESMPYAMDLLSHRLPPRSRSDFPAFLERFGLPGYPERYSDLTILAYTGAKSTGDSFSICDSFDGFDGKFSYVFDLCGCHRYFENYEKAKTDDDVIFMAEPENQNDPNAIRIANMDGRTIGYVNRFQAQKVGSWLDHGSIKAKILRVNGSRNYPRVFIWTDIITNINNMALAA